MIIGLTDDWVSVKLVTLDLHIDVAFFSSCWRHYTDVVLRCTVGSTGAEDLAPGRLTSSLDNSMLNALMFVFDPSVKPCYWVFLTWLSMHDQMHRSKGAGVSGNHRMHRWWGIGLTGAADSASSRLICRGDHLNPWNIFYLWIFTILWRLYDWLDLSSWWWIGHGVSTIDWILRLDDELDLLNHIHGT